VRWPGRGAVGKLFHDKPGADACDDGPAADSCAFDCASRRASGNALDDAASARH